MAYTDMTLRQVRKDADDKGVEYSFGPSSWTQSHQNNVMFMANRSYRRRFQVRFADSYWPTGCPYIGTDIGPVIPVEVVGYETYITSSGFTNVILDVIIPPIPD